MNLENAKTEINRLGSKKGWPFEQEGQWELARVALKYATDATHLRETITDICENFDHCPDSRELRAALVPGENIPRSQRESCPLGECDGSGWVVSKFGQMSAASPCKCRARTA